MMCRGLAFCIFDVFARSDTCYSALTLLKDEVYGDSIVDHIYE
jgi:hypothetical protein